MGDWRSGICANPKETRNRDVVGRQRRSDCRAKDAAERRDIGGGAV
jgi:hypothetical protein